MSEEAGKPREFLLALVNSVAGRDDEFQDWYWNVHIPEILEMPEFISVQRYLRTEDPSPVAPFRYATVYEIEGSAAAARDHLFTSGIGGSDAQDLSSMVFAPFAAIGEPLTKATTAK